MDAEGGDVGFLLGAVTGLLGAVAVLSGRDSGGKTAEGGDEVMGDAERRDEASERQ